MAPSLHFDVTVETPAPGLTLRQPRRGYRYGVEAYALAAFALVGGPRTAIDLGTGSGIVALLLASAGVQVVAVERDLRWVALARANGVGRFEVLAADVREWEGLPAEVVVANPPWFDVQEGPVSPDSWRASSRATLHGGPEEFLACGLRHAPRVCLVGPRLPGGNLRRHARLGRLHLGEFAREPGETVEETWQSPAFYLPFRGNAANPSGV